jgi:DNA repair protein RecO (recombination protein O)
MRRASDEPAFVLHRYDWSESSLILEVFTRSFGRIALAAKGAKRPNSSLRTVLLPMQPLRLSFGGDAEVRTLRSAEWVGGQAMPSGKDLLTGFYVNELVLRMLAREDPHERLFDGYAALVGLVGRASGFRLQAGLRAFELILLREVGLLPAFDHQSMTMEPLEPLVRYCWVPDAGLREARADDGPALPGEQWLALHGHLGNGSGLDRLIDACLAASEPLRHQTRAVLHYHCGGMNLRTRDMMMELRQL